MREYIKDFYGRILGSIETSGSKQTAYDFYGKILGTYDASTNQTKDFYGKILAYGNILSALIWEKR